MRTLAVIPGREPATKLTSILRWASEPGIYRTAKMQGEMDSGPAPDGVSRNDEELDCVAALAMTRNSSVSNVNVQVQRDSHIGHLT